MFFLPSGVLHVGTGGVQCTFSLFLTGMCVWFASIDRYSTPSLSSQYIEQGKVTVEVSTKWNYIILQNFWAWRCHSVKSVEHIGMPTFNVHVQYITQISSEYLLCGMVYRYPVLAHIGLSTCVCMYMYMFMFFIFFAILIFLTYVCIQCTCIMPVQLSSCSLADGTQIERPTGDREERAAKTAAVMQTTKRRRSEGWGTYIHIWNHFDLHVYVHVSGCQHLLSVYKVNRTPGGSCREQILLYGVCIYSMYL